MKKVSGSISVQDLSLTGTVHVDELEEVRLWAFALGFDRLAKAQAFDFNAQSSNWGFLLIVVQIRDQLV